MLSPILRKTGQIAVLAGLVAGCSAAGSATDQAGRVRPAQTSLPRGTEDPQVRAAVLAYEDFILAFNQAQRKPAADVKALPENADFTRFSFDPIAAEFEATVRKLSLAKSEYRGTPPRSHVTLTSVDPDATPWPTVTLSDCQTGQDEWKAFNTQANKPVPNQEPRVQRPYGTVVTVIYNHERWGVNTIRADPTRTCPG